MAALGKGGYHHLAGQKLLPFAPLKGTQWAESGQRLDPPMLGGQGQASRGASRLSPTAAISMPCSPLQ